MFREFGLQPLPAEGFFFTLKLRRCLNYADFSDAV